MKFEYGAINSRYTLEAENKLTAYCAMCAHFNNLANLIVIYKPEEFASDSWTSFEGKVSDKLSKIFGDDDSFDKYFTSHTEEITRAYRSIERLDIP